MRTAHGLNPILTIRNLQIDLPGDEAAGRDFVRALELELASMELPRNLSGPARLEPIQIELPAQARPNQADLARSVAVEIGRALAVDRSGRAQAGRRS